MSEKTLKLNNIRLNEKEFHKSKQPVDLMPVNVYQIVVSDKFKHSNQGFKYFIGYQKYEIVKPLCIILPQMSGYIKYFENGGKNMSFLIKNDEVWDKYNQIWDWDSEPVYEYKYLKAKVREFDGVIKTNFLGNDMPKENMHYICIACITIDSVMRMDKNNQPQVFLEECKYRVKKIQMSRFISAKLESDLESGSKVESKSKTELMAKLKSSSDSDSE